MTDKRVYRKGDSGKVKYVHKSEIYMPKALQKIVAYPKFTGFTTIQKAMAMDELEKARATCRAMMIVKRIKL